MAETQTAPTTTTNPTTPPQTANGLDKSTPHKPPSSAPTPATPKPEVRMLKLKLDGKEVELPESEVIARAMKASGADKRFDEAAQLRKQAEEVIQFAKENPKEFFKRTGMNARQWAEEYLMQELQAEAMSPEQRRAAENEAKLKQYESERKQAEESARQKEMDQLRDKHAANYDKLFVEALGKCGLPKTNFTIKRMAELQLVNIKQKLELDADQLAKLVKEDFLNEQKSLIGAYEGDQLLEFLGEDLVKKLSKAQIAKLKAKSAKSVSGDQHRPKRESEGSNGVTWREYQMRNRGRR